MRPVWGINVQNSRFVVALSAEGCPDQPRHHCKGGSVHAPPVNPIPYDAGWAIEARRKRALPRGSERNFLLPARLRRERQ